MSRLTCTQCESMLLDAADGLLLPEDETHFQLHLADCPTCTEAYADIQRGGAWMEMLKDAPPVPPEGLVDRILAQTSGNPQVAHAVMAETAHAASIFGHSQGAKVLPFRVPPSLQQPRTPWARMVHTVMQPRFAMTAAMAFFSIALTMNLAGVRLSSLRASDLKPANVRKSFWAANSQVVRYYDNLRVVYELESRVREMQKDSDGETAPRSGILSAPLNTTRPSNEPEPKTQPSGQPRSSAPRLHREGPLTLSDPGGNRTRLERVQSNQSKRIAAQGRGEGVQA